MNSSPDFIEQTKASRSPLGFLKHIQNKISSSPASYLGYCFAVPLILTFLIYLSMGIHPFGNGSVLVLDLNGQYVYFFESLRNAVYGEGSFLYSFFRALGGEYMGMYAYYLASPLSYIVALFPQDRILEALFTIILLKAGLSGFTFGFFLHKHTANPNKIITIAFSAMYALCSFAVVHQNNVMWIDAIIWLPIITYAIEQLIKHRKYKLYVISLAMAMMSNYYIGYMICIWCVLYFFYYFLAHDESVHNPHDEKLHGVKAFLRFGAFSLLAAAISAFILLAAYYSLTFGKNEFSDPNWSLRAKFDLLDFFTKFLPGSYDTVRPEGLPFVYCGLMAVILAPVYFITKRISSREKLATLALLGILVLCFIASPLDLIWHGFQNPNWLNHRYSFMFCFALLVVGYKAFGNLRRAGEKVILAICAFIILFVVLAQKQELKTYVVSDEALHVFYTVWLSVIFTVILFGILCLIIRTSSFRKRESITAVLAALICVEMFCNALTMVVQFDDDVTYSTYSSYNNYISALRPVVNKVKEEDTSFYRMEKTSHRKYNDNMALGIRGLSNSTSTLNSSTISFLGNMGYTARAHLSKYLGGNPVNDSLLGVKYLIDLKDSEKLIHYYEKQFTEQAYDVYKNPYALSVAYGVSGETLSEFNFSDHTTYFEKLNAFVGALRGTETEPQIFKPITDLDSSCKNCTETSNYTQLTYTPNEGSAATVTFSFKATEAADYYFYTPSNNPKECALSVNGTSLGKYLGSDTKHIFHLGWFEEDENVSVTITMNKETLSLVRNCNYVWYIDRDEFEESFADLLDNPQFIIDDGFTDDHLVGTMTTTEDTTNVMTTISYDEGWKIYVDGDPVEIYRSVDALIGFDIVGAGEHTVEMRYMPDIYRLGMTVSIIGITAFIVLCVMDLVLKKTLMKNKVLKCIDTPWVLEDFDEDNEELSKLSETTAPRKTLKDRLSFFNILNKKKAADTDSTVEKADNENTNDNGEL